MDFTGSLFHASNALNRQLGHMADEAFREFGLTSSYAFMIMMVHEQPGIQPTELSEKLQLTPSTITRLVEKMEYRGYMQRSNEGRATYISLTDKGEKMISKLNSAWSNLQERYTHILGERYTEVLAEMTQKASVQINEAEE